MPGVVLHLLKKTQDGFKSAKRWRDDFATVKRQRDGFRAFQKETGCHPTPFQALYITISITLMEFCYLIFFPLL
jgi:hypothetical protein